MENRREVWRRMSVVGVSVGLMAMACGGSDSANAPGPSEGTDASVLDAALPSDAASDAPSDDAGEIIGDGGSNIDPDAGDVPTAPDGGKCNTLDNIGGVVTSTCATSASALKGGPLAAGTYVLTRVDALATASFCSTQFVPSGFKQTVVLTANANGFDLASVQEIGGTNARHRNDSLVPAGNVLTASHVCPSSSSTTVRYSSGVVAGKQTLVMRLPYGSAEALYTYVEN